MTQPDWPARLSANIAARVKYWRGRRGLSAQQLADKVTAAGYPLARSVIANFESGRRPSITVAEWFALAAALDVPPVLLVAPVLLEPEVEALPGITADPAAVMNWVSGEGPPPGADPGPRGDFDRGVYLSGALPLRLHRLHESVVGGWLAAWRFYEQAPAARQAPEVEEMIEWVGGTTRLGAHEAVLRQVEADVESVRARIRGFGWILPPLPAQLVELDAAWALDPGPDRDAAVERARLRLRELAGWPTER